MASNYKKLGLYIREINERNIDLRVTNLLGVSIQKVFMPSIANTVGTDMSKYKIVRKNQFAYGPVTSRNGDKISVALLQEHDEAIISQAYISFELTDHNALDPEYLMMWFRRPEFDRYARFKSHGSARETFDWEEMCDTELPIPSIEIQRALVKEYNTITDRIALNEQLNQKLEETAQTLYRHWFVDFEFPYDFEKGEPSIKGKPYKSNGGEMVWCAELEKEIPSGWEVKPLGEVIESYSKSHKFDKVELIFFNTSDILNGEFLHSDYSDIIGLPGQAKKSIRRDDILFSEIRPANKRFAMVRVENAGDYVVSTKLMVLRIKDSEFTPNRLYHFLTRDEFLNELHQAAEGRSGTFPQITFEGDLETKWFIVGCFKIEQLWSDLLQNHYGLLHSIKDEFKQLETLRSIVLSKMSTEEMGVAGGVGVG